MPTAARLAAAVLFAGLAYYVSTVIQGYFVDERPLPTLPMWNAFFGLICGWRIAGSRAGQGVSGAISYGLTTVTALAIVALFFHSSAEMVTRSMRGQYGGPAEAVVTVAELMYDFGMRIFTPEVLLLSFGGGVVCALIVEAVGRRYA
ncbi:MAG: TrgA family protein [Pseudomonadota bacterium]